MGFVIALGIIVLLPLIILFLPVYIRLYKDRDGKAQVSIKVLCFPISLEKKNKKEKKENPVLNQLGLSQYTGSGNWKKRIAEKGLLSTLKEFLAILKPFFSALGQIAKKFRVRRAKLLVVTAGDNAAMEYGIACATVYPLSAFLQNRTGAAVDVEVRCDFEGFEGDISYDLVLCIFVANLIPVGIRILKTLLKEGKQNERK